MNQETSLRKLFIRIGEMTRSGNYSQDPEFQAVQNMLRLVEALREAQGRSFEYLWNCPFTSALVSIDDGNIEADWDSQKAAEGLANAEAEILRQLAHLGSTNLFGCLDD